MVYRGGGGFGSSRGGFGGGGGGRKPSELGEKLRKPHWDMSRLLPFQKNFYQEHPRVAMRREVNVMCKILSGFYAKQSENGLCPLIFINKLVLIC